MTTPWRIALTDPGTFPDPQAFKSRGPNDLGRGDGVPLSNEGGKGHAKRRPVSRRLERAIVCVAEVRSGEEFDARA